ncbi:hypothetical protein [Kitasatospora sp. NPDC005748]|uniref:hypothetical protein n=1 Tax=Kitasatospora sp. NPDC005748 TaxID=3157063 RepID=UPI0033D2875D
MNTATAAALAGRTRATIRIWCSKGVIAAVKQSGRWSINAASLADRIALPSRLRPAQEPCMDLTATYTHTYAGATEPTIITPVIKTNIRRGVAVTSVTGLAPLLADHLATIDERNRLHTLEALRTARIVIADSAVEDEPTGTSQAISWADYGRLTTTYDSTVGLPASVVLDLAARIRAAL